MTQYYGDFSEDSTVYIPLNTFSSDDPSASVTITNLADADIKVHKDGSVTQIVTDGATVAIDFDSITGNHLITIDTSVHADYSTGSDYLVRMEGTTIDGATVNAWIGSFSIENRHSAGPTAAAIADQVWDEALSGHQTAGTAGRNLTFAGAILAETTVTGTPSTTVIRLSAGSSTNDFYNDMECYFISGNNAGLSRIVTDYNGTTKDVTFDEALPLTPTASDAVVIKTNHKHTRSQIATSVTADVDANSTQLAAIVSDTSELQTDWADGGRLDLIIDSILTDTGELQSDDVPGLIAALNNVSTSDVLTQVNSALDTAISELGVAQPTATPTLRTGLMLLYMALRNKTVTQTSGTDALELYNNAGTKICSKLLTDDGSDYTESKMT